MHKHTALGIVLLASLAVLVAACSIPFSTSGNALVGSGKFATRNYALDGFTAIQANGGFQVTLSGGDAFKVTVTADDNLLDVIDVRKDGSALVIGLKPGSIRSNKLEAAVTLPVLEAVRLDGGSGLSVSGNAPRAGTLTINANGGARADLRAVAADRVSIILNGGAQATVNAKRLDYDLNGGAQLRYTGNPTIGSAKTEGGAQATSF